MSHFKVEKVASGLVWVEVEAADLRVCCGCPPDSTKFLNRLNLFGNDAGEKTGPNALLVGDARVEHGRMVSFAEFPVMQMLYMQGMIANAGRDDHLPLVMGLKENVDVQLSYLCRGNYGYFRKTELIESGCTEEEAEALFQMKLWFANGKIYRPKELCKSLYLDNKAHEIKNGVFIQRIGFNLFQFVFGDEKIEIDLSESNEERELPFHLRDHMFRYSGFSVLHSGEGNGWEPENPCMGSLIINNGCIYAVDAGPRFLEVINRLGIDVHDLEGVFITHIHDDHFAGIPDLLRSSKRLKLFSTPLVIHTVRKKFSALMDLDEGAFSLFFEVVALAFDKWNAVDHMEVMPFFSPHPVETNAFIFRKKHSGGRYKTYAHLADTVSLKNLEKIEGFDSRLFRDVKQKLLFCADIKKVDVGGGFIHGERSDYLNDESGKMVLSHNKFPSFRVKNKEVLGRVFGKQDVLIRGVEKSYHKIIFARILKNNFPDLTDVECGEIFKQASLCKMLRHDVLKENEGCFQVILNGNIALANVRFDRRIIFDRNHIFGLFDINKQEESYLVSTAFTDVISFSKDALFNVVDQKLSWKKFLANKAIIYQLMKSRLFEHFANSALLIRVATKAEILKIGRGQELMGRDLNHLYILEEGEAYFVTSKSKTKINRGDYFGGNQMFRNDYGKYKILFDEDSRIMRIPSVVIRNFPLVLWKVYENCTTLNHICKAL